MKQLLRLTTLAALLLTPIVLQAQNTSVFTTGLRAPTKIIRTPEGNLLTTGTNSENNTGNVTFVERTGAHRSLIGGLPSGISVEGNPSGPEGLLLDNRVGAGRRRSRTLFILNGISGAVRFATGHSGSKPRRSSLTDLEFRAAR